MKEIKEKLIQKAKETHGKILPTGYRFTLDECFTKHENKILFWFNVEHDESTRILVHEELDYD